MRFLPLLAVFILTTCATAQQGSDASLTVTARQPVLPVLADRDHNRVLDIELQPADTTTDYAIAAFTFSLEGTTDINDIAGAQVQYASPNNETASFGTQSVSDTRFTIRSSAPVAAPGKRFWLSLTLDGNPDLSHRVAARLESVELADGTTVTAERAADSRPQRIGIALRTAGEEGVDTYRIPGLATTNEGTLIAVYDARYDRSRDLQGDIDVAMSRSTDGGQTWEPMQIIMDMGTYGGLPEDQNGIGDPAVLVDRNTNTIWVAALWLHGKPGDMAWHSSEPGLSPEETGQFILVKSEDDGLTWSEPINVTTPMKDPDWRLFFNGPGKGITMSDGTLVFPAQFRDAEGTPHSTIVYSKDQGESWQVSTGAKSETTEAQVVELSDGSLMLNMRDDRNRSNRNDSLNGRSVAITRDMGQTWTEHPTSRRALISPNCMASIISYEQGDEHDRILFFSNPASRTQREHMTIKTSFDDGMTWPDENQLELYEDGGFGYSCMTVIDEDHIGILYEGVKELYFEKVSLDELMDRKP